MADVWNLNNFESSISLAPVLSSVYWTLRLTVSYSLKSHATVETIILLAITFGASSISVNIHEILGISGFFLVVFLNPVLDVCLWYVRINGRTFYILWLVFDGNMNLIYRYLMGFLRIYKENKSY
jgi:hypothetical protein